MDSVNRAALVVFRKDPYVEWANGVDASADAVTLDDLNREPTIYLIPEYELETEVEALIDEVAEDIFTQELYGWCADSKKFPPKRTAERFREWFAYQISSIVLDVFDGDELKHDG